MVVTYTDEYTRFSSLWGSDRIPLPVYDGSIPIGLSDQRVNYHASCCFDCLFSKEEVRGIMQHTSRIACMTLEILRRRQPCQLLSKVVSQPCLEKLETMQTLLEDEDDLKPRSTKPRIFPPIEPFVINAMFRDEKHLDTIMGIRIAKQNYWSNLTLERTYSTWVCTSLDIG